MSRFIPSLFIFLVLSLPQVIHAAAPPFVLYRSGQSESQFAGDDGALAKGLAWPNPRFTGTGDNGRTDGLTGLSWPTGGSTAGPALCGPGIAKSWSDAHAYVKCLNANKYLNQGDWRLPNRGELLSLMNHGNPTDNDVWLATNGFTDIQTGSDYWSSTTHATTPAKAWSVNLSTGLAGSQLKSAALPVLPVRGGTLYSAAYTATPLAVGDGGTVSPASPQTVPTNSTAVFDVRPADGYRIFSAAGCEGSIDTNSFSTGPMNGNCTVTALFVPNAPAPPPFVLYRSGQSESQFAGDDAALAKGRAWPDPRFTGTGDNGRTDGLTGLSWPTGGSTAGPALCGAGIAKSWSEALAYVKCLNAGKYLNQDDWRLPNRGELLSLMNHGRPTDNDVWLATNGFTDIQSGSDYWSSTTYAATPAKAWSVNLRTGLTGGQLKSAALPVLPVRGGTLYSAAYTATPLVIGDGTVSPASPQTVPANSAAVFEFRPADGYRVFSVGGCDGSLDMNSFSTGPMNGNCTVTALFVPTTPAPPPFTLYRSGQSASEFAGDDGSLARGRAWPAPRFTGTGDNGRTDSLTGLSWPAGGFTAGPALCGAGVAKGWSDALAYVKCLNTNKYLNQADWRLPNRGELLSLMNHGYPANNDAWLATNGFTDIQTGSDYWSSTTHAATPAKAWSVNLRTGLTGSQLKSAALPVLPVRGGTPSSATYTATPQVIGGGGSISPASPQTVPTTATAAFEIRPADGYRIFSVGGCDGSLDMNSFTTGPVNGNCTITALFVPTAPAPPPFVLYRSGQSVSEFAGDDGALAVGRAWPDPRFTGAGGNGRTDNLTGLSWPAAGFTAGPAPCGAGVAKSWSDALAYVKCLNTNLYLTQGDWRLPNRVELLTLMNHGYPTSNDAWLTASGFTGIQTGSDYWSSTTDAATPANAWSVNLKTGLTGSRLKSAALPVLPVRGGFKPSYAITSLAAANGTLTPTQSVDEGGDATVEARPATGHHLASVLVDGVSQALPNRALWSYTFSNVRENHTVSAAFAVDTFTVTAVGGSGGTLTCPQATVTYNGSLSCTATPATGYRLVSLTDNGQDKTASLSGTTYQLSAVAADHALVAEFAVKTFTVLPAFNAGGTVACESPVEYGNSSTCTVTPDAGHHLTAFGVDGQDRLSQVNGGLYSIASITSDRSVSAQFTIYSYPITFGAPGGKGSIDCTTPAAHGSSSVCTVTPQTGYVLVSLTDNGEDVVSRVGPAGYRIDNVVAGHALTAVFGMSNFSISAAVSGGNGAMWCPESGAYGTKALCTIAPDAGYHLASLVDNGANVYGSVFGYGYTIASLTADHAVTAAFAANPPNLAPAAKPPQTRQALCRDPAGTIVDCRATGQDGDLRAGVAVPSGEKRFADNGDGTLTDLLTGIIWLKDAACLGRKAWDEARQAVAQLGSDLCGLTDGSYPGNWRLPTINELATLQSFEGDGAGSLNAAGFSGVAVDAAYGSSTTYPADSGVDIVAQSFSTAATTRVNSLDPAGMRMLAVREDSSPLTIAVPRTGQKSCWSGRSSINCTGTGQDGEQQNGAAWPTARFANLGTGAIADRLTGLVWARDFNLVKLRDPSFDADGGAGDGAVTLFHALEYVAGLNSSGYLGHDDWRLPNVRELVSLVNRESGTLSWLAGAGFTGYEGLSSSPRGFWSSTFASPTSAFALIDRPGTGEAGGDTRGMPAGDANYLLPVRGGEPHPLGSSPMLVAAPALVQGGLVKVGNASVPKTVTLANGGGAPLSISYIAPGGADNAMFAVAAGGTSPCASLTPVIDPGESCTVAVTFRPASVGQKSAVLEIASDDPVNRTLYQPLAGTGTTTFSVTAAVSGGNGTLSCPQTVNYGANANCTLTNSTGYHLASLLDNGVEVVSAVTASGYAIPGLTANHALTAVFDVNRYAVTFASAGNGSVAGNVSQSVAHNGSATAVTAQADSDYRFLNWTGPNGFSSTGNPLTLSSITGDAAVTANFTRNIFAVAAQKSGSGEIKCDTPVTSGNNSVCGVTPGNGYILKTLTDNGIDVTSQLSNGNYTVSGVRADHTVVATFAVPQIVAFSLDKSEAAAGTVSSDPAGISCGTLCSGTIGSFLEGARVNLTATPAFGYYFLNWSNCDSPDASTCALTAAASHPKITANFGAKKGTILTATAPQTQKLTLNAPLTIGGALATMPAGASADLNGQEITVTVKPLTGTAVTRSARTTDETGAWQITLNDFTRVDTYLVEIGYAGSGKLLASDTAQPLNVLVGKSAGYAVVVQGKTTDNNLLNDHRYSAEDIIAKLKSRSFLDEDIKALYSDETGAPTRDAVRSAVETWAKDKMNGSPAPLYLIMVDHGDVEQFHIGSQVITPGDLKSWLAALEANLTPQGLLEKRTVIIGSCFSGSFIKDLSAPGRIVITSAGPDERSIGGDPRPWNNTTVYSGELFLEELFSSLATGSSLGSSYARARDNVADKDPRRSAGRVFHYGRRDNLMQHPLLDDNGDGSGEYELVNDGAQVASLNLGYGKIRTNGADNPAYIAANTPAVYLGAAESAAQLWLAANDDGAVDYAWITVKKPDSTATSTGSGQVILNYDKKDLVLNSATGRWEYRYAGFDIPGTYEIFYYTRDKATGFVSPTVRSFVYKAKDGNTAPGPFNLISPGGTQESTYVGLLWEDSGDPDGLTYTVEVSRDQTFAAVDYRKEGIADIFTDVPNDALKNHPNGTVWYWRVIATDPYGAKQLSGRELSFTTSNTNGLPGLIKGYLYNESGAAIAGATLSTGSRTARTMSNGAFLFVVPPGAHTITATATGYRTKTRAALAVSPGKVYDASMLLSPSPVNGSCGTAHGGIFDVAPVAELCAAGTATAMGGGGPWNWSCAGAGGGSTAACSAGKTAVITKPGDCDGDGTVTIAEVRSAVDMFLGLKPAAACVDRNGANGVALIEVQEVMNGFLGP